MNFSIFLEAVEDGIAKSQLVDFISGEETEITLSPAYILKFVTRNRQVPPISFTEPPTISFLYEDAGRKRYANKHVNTIAILVHDGLLTDC